MELSSLARREAEGVSSILRAPSNAASGGRNEREGIDTSAGLI
jgi:hypothetical protein